MAAMTPLQFVEKWRDSVLRERQGAQSHFIELCDLLGEPRPADPATYCFERGVEKAGGGDGWADVWRRGCFAWEYKGKHKDLGAALRQLQTYTLDLQMPPYLVVSDMDRIVVHTNWNNTVSERHEWTLDDLLDASKRDLLKQVFNGSEKLKPHLSPQELTDKAARAFGDIGRRLQERGHDPRPVAHFLNRLIFCMFAEDVGLLPDKLFSRMMKAVETNPDAAAGQMRDLFAKMHKGGFFGEHRIDWFNGGLFDSEDILPLEVIDLKQIAKTADDHDWSEIDPAIFGTLFEQALKATRERPALGAHYTDREKILKIVDPVITRPLMAEWDVAHAEIAAFMDDARAAEGAERAIREEAAAEMAADPKKAKAGEEARRKRTTAVRRDRSKALAAAKDRLDAFLDRLSKFRVLDPACGSGNFLYVALHALHDIERRAHGDCLRLGLEPPPLRVSVRQLRGIEIERYAAELARVTLWIGDLQWLKKNGYLPDRRPILDTLDQIEERDALLDRSKGDDPATWTEAVWPETDVIIGNPPFLGRTFLRENLGDATVDSLFKTYQGRVPADADFVCYWVEKSWRAISLNRAERAGLVTTNSIRGGSNRRVIDPIADAGAVMEAWPDEEWTLHGAAVRVSQIGFGAGFGAKRLIGEPADRINADLTGTATNLTKAQRLVENAGCCSEGVKKYGAFDVSGDQARAWLSEPANVNGRSNVDVIRPLLNGRDLVQRSADTWVIDFFGLEEVSASQYQAPFQHVLFAVKPTRDHDRSATTRNNWWLFERNRPDLRTRLFNVNRYIVGPIVAKHRLITWLPTSALISNLAYAIVREDDTTFGILHSYFHELWALRLGTWLGVGNDPRYTPTTTFETFPFPEGLTPNIPAAQYANDPRAIAIAEAARELNEKREAWLNPPEWVDRVPEVVPGYPDRIVPKDADAAQKLKDRTLTKLYNERPAWLDHLHRRLDEAVAAAYGWPVDLSDEEILAKLFALNQERAAAGR
jgi:type II restriction/modification system DNA methylase subunit YeeA